MAGLSAEEAGAVGRITDEMSERDIRLVLLAALDRFNELQEQAARRGVAMNLELIDGAFLCDQVKWTLVVDLGLGGKPLVPWSS